MVTIEYLLSNKDNLQIPEDLTAGDIALLAELLGEKNDSIRYAAFLMLKEISKGSNGVYVHWDDLAAKLKSENSYQRSIGAMLISENARWDTQNKLNLCLDDYLKCCDDEKFITARQVIQAVLNIAKEKPQLMDTITTYLMGIDILKRKDTQKKLLLCDIVLVLAQTQKVLPRGEVSRYLHNAATGGLLDKKTIRQIL
jgi:hypothetical protein